MEPWMVLLPPAFVLAEGVAVALAIVVWDQLHPTAKEAAAVDGVTVNYDLTAPAPDDLPDFDATQTYCPACLARWHEFNTSGLYRLVPAGDPSLCEQHTRRLSQTRGLDPRALARGSVAWLLYGIRPHQTEEAE